MIICLARNGVVISATASTAERWRVASVSVDRPVQRGSADRTSVGVNLIIEESKVEFPKGKGAIKTYADPDTLSGTPVNRNFCGTCGW
jgi:hypothetical protein